MSQRLEVGNMSIVQRSAALIAIAALAFAGQASAQDSADVTAKKNAAAAAAAQGKAAPNTSYIAGYVYAPGTYPLGKTYSALAADWWKWVLKSPKPKSPFIDATGVNCKEGQSSSYATVWYLAGIFEGDGTITRNCTIPVGRHILFPVLNTLAAAFPTDPAAEKTEAYLRGLNEYIGEATNLEVEIDGTTVPNVARWYEESVRFNVTLPANNIYDLPTGQQLNPAYDAGYYLAITPLPYGQHTIHFHGEVAGAVQDVTYNITIR